MLEGEAAVENRVKYAMKLKKPRSYLECDVCGIRKRKSEVDGCGREDGGRMRRVKTVIYKFQFARCSRMACRVVAGIEQEIEPLSDSLYLVIVEEGKQSIAFRFIAKSHRISYKKTRDKFIVNLRVDNFDNLIER